MARITLNQPERGNPIDAALAAELRCVAQQTLTDKAVRAIILDARGRYFSVGGDLKQLVESRETLQTRVRDMLRDLVVALDLFSRGDAPMIAAVHGVTAGGAVGVVSGCDLVLAVPEATFVPAFSAIGLCPDSSASYFLPRRVGLARAQEFFLCGDAWDVQTAQSHGLVNRIVPAEDLASATWTMARKFAAAPTLGMGETRRLLARSGHTTLEDQLAFEAAAIQRLIGTDDAWEGITALVEKRAPEFRRA